MTGYDGPETELLLRCAAPPGNGGHAERIRELSGQPLNWEGLLGLAARHKLKPLLYWGLKASRPEVIPESLTQDFLENTRHSFHLTSELVHLVEFFASEGIGVLAVKGPTLAVAAYGNLALRRFMDLDLLIRKKDILQARGALLRTGYRSTLPVKEKWIADYLRNYDEFGMRGPNNDPLVELHWGITPRYFSVPLEIEAFWGRSVSVNLGSREVATPGVDDLLLLLCLHAAKHCWSALSMVSDIAWLLAKWKIDWNAVMERAGSLGSTRMVLLGASLAGSLLDAPLPEPILRRASDDCHVQGLAAGAIDRLIGAKALRAEASEGSGILTAGLFHVKARERWQDRVRYVVRLTTTVGVEDWDYADLPPSLSFLYPALRVPRLLRKYWMRIP